MSTELYSSKLRTRKTRNKETTHVSCAISPSLSVSTEDALMISALSCPRLVVLTKRMPPQDVGRTLGRAEEAEAEEN